MAWYWIVACVVGYFVIGSIIAVVRELIVYGEIDGDFEDLSGVIVVAWPLFAVIFAIIGPPYAIYMFVCLLIEFLGDLFTGRLFGQKKKKQKAGLD